jgi:DNA-binding MarR family transcriptional regulator
MAIFRGLLGIADRTDYAQLSGNIVQWILALMVAAMQSSMTPTQGQYLAFIYAYTRVLRRPPAEADIQKYFEVAPPTVHQMLITLERKGLIRRTPGVARSIELLIAPNSLPVLR